MKWITHNGVSCPCIGYLCEIRYNDGATEIGIARDTVYWRYVEKYRLL